MQTGFLLKEEVEGVLSRCFEPTCMRFHFFFLQNLIDNLDVMDHIVCLLVKLIDRLLLMFTSSIISGISKAFMDGINFLWPIGTISCGLFLSLQ